MYVLYHKYIFFQILLMLGVSLMTTVAYEFILTIADSENVSKDIPTFSFDI